MILQCLKSVDKKWSSKWLVFHSLASRLVTFFVIVMYFGTFLHLHLTLILGFFQYGTIVQNHSDITQLNMANDTNSPRTGSRHDTCPHLALDDIPSASLSLSFLFLWATVPTYIIDQMCFNEHEICLIGNFDSLPFKYYNPKSSTELLESLYCNELNSIFNYSLNKGYTKRLSFISSCAHCHV